MQPFAEAPAWSEVGSGWRPLFGHYRSLGFSFEWHSFTPEQDFDWERSFHPGSLELCLNLSGQAYVQDSKKRIDLENQSLAFYYQGTPSLVARRQRLELHQFITVEFAPQFLAKHLGTHSKSLDPLLSTIVNGHAVGSAVSAVQRIPTPLLSIVQSLQHPPVFAPAQEIWFQSKALEIAAQVFFRPAEGELFCTRAQRATRERVERARAILRERLTDPPALEELGRLVGCSQFHLSRMFSQETGMTIQQYIRQVRMERAAELLKAGKCNVTEAALEVGYNSLSHFSSAFHETFGCCPGLYPLKMPAQKSRK